MRIFYVLLLLACVFSSISMLARNQEVDGECAEEAANWLEFTNTQNILTNTDRQLTKGYVQLLNNAGAARVWCIYVTKHAMFKANKCNSLLVEIPREAEKKNLLKALARIENVLWGESARQQPDESLKYL